jgi:hypothetical protein
MATETAFGIDDFRPAQRHRTARLKGAGLLVLYAGLPLGLFGLLNLLAEALGHMPLFFSPFGLPGWAGAALYLVQLPLLGAAAGLVALSGHRGPQYWLAGLLALLIAFPFLVAPLDSLQLSLVTVATFLLALGTLLRTVAVAPLAGWLMAPCLVWMGVSATLGLLLAAAWSPPFALANGQHSAAAA